MTTVLQMFCIIIVIIRQYGYLIINTAIFWRR